MALLGGVVVVHGAMMTYTAGRLLASDYVVMMSASTPPGGTPTGAAAGNPAAEAPRAPAPDNYRGRFNADRAARGEARLPDDWDAHHRIPQEYIDHPEFKDFDFHQPSNIQGVKGSRADVNIHQKITNEWTDFRALNPNATRAQIEEFAATMDAKYAQFWFK